MLKKLIILGHFAGRLSKDRPQDDIFVMMDGLILQCTPVYMTKTKNIRVVYFLVFIDAYIYILIFIYNPACRVTDSFVVLDLLFTFVHSLSLSVSVISSLLEIAHSSCNHLDLYIIVY
jgi:hypothetical protein